MSIHDFHPNILFKKVVNKVGKDILQGEWEYPFRISILKGFSIVKELSIRIMLFDLICFN